MERYCIKVPTKEAEKVRRILLDNELLDGDFKIFSSTNFIFLPIVRLVPLQLLKELQLSNQIEVVKKEFDPIEKPPTLEGILGFNPQHELIGNVAIIDSEIDQKKEVANALLKAYPKLKTVVASKSPVQGEFRVKKYEFVKGECTTETVHKENGCKFTLDLEKTYFTPRLATERQRVASNVCKGDKVIDMFAGVGPYSILIAKSGLAEKIVAIDKNPNAISYLKKNIKLNKVENIDAIEADARYLSSKYNGFADHIIMNLPHSAYEFLDSAISMVKAGGIIYYYTINPENNLFGASIKQINESCEKLGKECIIKEERIVRSYAPHQYNICIEFRVNNDKV